MSIEVMKQALEYVQEFKRRWWAVPPFGNKVNKATREAVSAAHSPIFQIEDALRAAIEQAQRNEFNPDWDQVEALRESLREHMAEIQRLRQWQGLTADEIWDEWCKQTKPERDTRNFVAAFAIAIEAKLRAKNT